MNCYTGGLSSIFADDYTSLKIKKIVIHNF
jgi:hypothetical protein